MYVFLKNNKVAIRLEHGDDFKAISEKIKGNLSPYTFDPEDKLWYTEKMNLLIMDGIFNNPYKKHDDVSILQNKQKEYLIQLNISKETEYSDILHNTKEKVKLFSHQKTAINYMLKNYPCGLFDEQGLGKTLTTICVLGILFEKKEIEKAIIICPNSLKHNWNNEIILFSNLTCVMLDGSKVNRIKQLEDNFNIYITNFESLALQDPKKREEKEKRKLAKIPEEFRDNFKQKKKRAPSKESLEFKEKFENLIDEKTCICIDEVHRIKSGSSIVSEFIRELGIKTKYKYILTGTLIANKPEDVFYPFLFLDCGETLGKNYYNFLKQYCYLGNSFSRMAITGYKNLQKLKFLIQLKSIRRLKDDVLDLPEKIIEDRIVEITHDHLKFYDDLIDNMIDVISDEGIEKHVDPYLIKLIQAASNPLLIDKDTKVISSKIKELDSLLNEHIELSDSKVVLWTNYVNNFELLLNRYKKYNPVYIRGGVSIEDRNENVKNFQNDPNIKLIICNPAAASVGLTLTASNISIFFDRDFVLVNYKQAIDRIHRIGQNKRCLIINLICSNTVDEIISKSLFSKDTIASFLQGDIKDLEKVHIDKKKILRDILNVKKKNEKVL